MTAASAAPSDRLVLVQKSLGTRVTYSFGAEEFVYSLKDFSGELEFPVKYSVVNVLEPYTLTIIDRPLRVRIWVVAVIALGVDWLTYVLNPTLGAALLCLSAPVALFSLLARFTSVLSLKCTMLKMSPPPAGAGARHLRIMKRGNHDDILAALKTRWREQLRELHSEVNVENDPKQEATKFKWLRDRGVISEAEYQAALSELQSPAPETKAAPQRVLN